MAGCMLVIDGSLDGHAVPQTNQRKEGNPASTPKCPVETRDVVITHTSARMQQQAGCRLERVSTGSAPSLPPWRAKRAPAPPHLCVTLASKYHLSIGSELVSASQFRCTSKSVDRLVRRVLANHEGCAGGGGAQQEGIVSGSALWIEGRAWVVFAAREGPMPTIDSLRPDYQHLQRGCHREDCECFSHSGRHETTANENSFIFTFLLCSSLATQHARSAVDNNGGSAG